MAQAVRTIGRHVQFEYKIIIDALEDVHGQTDIGEASAQLLRSFAYVDEFVEPPVTDFHLNCSRNRMSF